MYDNDGMDVGGDKERKVRKPVAFRSAHLNSLVSSGETG
jgi:hypothetical protein